MSLETLTTYAPLLPEVALLVGAMLLLMFGAFSNTNRTELITWLSVGVMVLAAVLVLRGGDTPVQLFEGAFVVDGMAQFMKVLVLVASVGALILSVDYLREEQVRHFEYPVLVLFAAAGMLVMISANDLIALYLGLELQSLSLYVLAAFRRDQVRSSEAGLKYFVLGALSSGMLLYGASFVYGFAGSTGFESIAEMARACSEAAGQASAKTKTCINEIGLIIGLVFVLVGLAFKISAVPFHMWTPDVYEGAPTPVTAFFAAAPKVAAMALLMRLVMSGFGDIAPKWQQIIVFLSIASMLLGSFAAIGQSNIKRLMAYSSIGHIGFALIGLAAAGAVMTEGSDTLPKKVADLEGMRGVLIYLAIYVAMTLGAFACIIAMRRSDGPVEDIEELSGLAQTNLPMAVVLAVLMFSMAGIPPLAGFFAKIYVFQAAIKAGLYPLAVIGVLASVVGCYYYLRVVKVMFFDEPKERFMAMSGRVAAIIGISGFLVLFFVIAPAPLVDVADVAAKSLLRP